MCFIKYFYRGIFGLIFLWKLIILFPLAKRFQQYRVIERFCVEGSNKRSDRGTL